MSGLTDPLGIGLSRPSPAELDARWREQQGRSSGAVLTRQLQGDVAALQAEGVHVVGAAGEPAFQNAWANLDARVACFWRAGDMVHLRGVVAAGTVGLAIFTLPVGYRPSAAGVPLQPVVSNNLFGAVSVSAAGVVALLIGSNAYVDLSPACFRVA